MATGLLLLLLLTVSAFASSDVVRLVHHTAVEGNSLREFVDTTDHPPHVKEHLMNKISVDSSYGISISMCWNPRDYDCLTVETIEKQLYSFCMDNTTYTLVYSEEDDCKVCHQEEVHDYVYDRIFVNESGPKWFINTETYACDNSVHLDRFCTEGERGEHNCANFINSDFLVLEAKGTTLNVPLCGPNKHKKEKLESKNSVDVGDGVTVTHYKHECLPVHQDVEEMSVSDEIYDIYFHVSKGERLETASPFNLSEVVRAVGKTKVEQKVLTEVLTTVKQQSDIDEVETDILVNPVKVTSSKMTKIWASVGTAAIILIVLVLVFVCRKYGSAQDLGNDVQTAG